MRRLVLGDVHGCLKALETLERAVAFGPDDVLISLGDYVDRGPDSRGVLDWMIDFGKRGKLVPLLGNHERMLLQVREDPAVRQGWLMAGGFETLISYSDGNRPGRVQDIPDPHWEFLENCLLYHETETEIFVHASVDPERELPEQTEEWLLWKRFDARLTHRSGKHVYCGHTPQKDGWPACEPSATCLDTFAYGGGWLTALDVASGAVWQADEQGNTRFGEWTPAGAAGSTAG